MTQVNLKELKDRVTAGLITERKHPTADLWIYNYTPQCQYGHNWDEYTLMCRGLILDGEGKIIARPFNKFFNLQEHKDGVPEGSFVLAEKMDGSLGIMYWTVEEGWAIATRGSFTSSQAIKGTELLQNYLQANGDGWINHHYTYLFEIIYPTNRIVVDYGDAERLVLLACIDTELGIEPTILSDYEDIVPIHQAEGLGVTTPKDLSNLSSGIANREGFVLRFSNGLRLKFKFDEYVRLHRILTETSSSVVWEVVAVEDMLEHFPNITPKQIGDSVRHIDKSKIQPIMDKQGKAINSLLENVPDEFHDWLRSTIETMQTAHAALLLTASELLVQTTDRREIVAHRATDPIAVTLALCMLDGKYEMARGLAWKNVKPEWTKPFLNDEG